MAIAPQGPRRFFDRRPLGRPALWKLAPLTRLLSQAARFGTPFADACEVLARKGFFRSIFYVQFPDLLWLHLGLPVYLVRRLLGRIAERRFWGRFVAHLRSGAKLSEVVEAYPDVFPAGYRALIRSGERGGDLPGVLRKAEEWTRWAVLVRARRRTRAVYPLTVLAVLFFVSFTLLWKVFPTLSSFSTAASGGIPGLARAFERETGLFLFLLPVVLLLTIIAVPAVAAVLYGSAPARDLRDRLSFRLGSSTWSGALFESAAVFGATALQLRAGTPLPVAFEEAAGGFSNGILRRNFVSLGEEISRGVRPTALSARPPLDRLGAGAVSASLAAGTLPETFELLSRRAAGSGWRRDRVFDALAGPCLTVAVGVLSAFAVISTYQLIFVAPAGVP